MFVTRRVTIITHEIRYFINACAAGQRDNAFDISVFTSGGAALDHMRQTPPDILLVDFRVEDVAGLLLIQQALKLQPQLVIVASPDTDDVRNALRDLDNTTAAINVPLSMRRLFQLLRKLATIASAGQQAGDTERFIPAEEIWGETPIMANQAQTLEFWVSDRADGTSFIELPQLPDASEPMKSGAESTRIFRKLAEEEPPLPGFEEGSTLHDVSERLRRTDLQLLGALRFQQRDDRDDDEAQIEDTGLIPATWILETALDESTPIEGFSLEEFVQRVQERRGAEDPFVMPLPQWLEEDRRYIREPDFLPDELPPTDQTLEYTATTTMPGEAQEIESDPSNMVTDPMEPVQRSRPAKEDDFIPPARQQDPADADQGESTIEHGAEPDSRPITMPEITIEPAELDDATTADSPSHPYVQYDETDPQIAQLAIALTQVSLELTSQATLLAQHGVIVAYAGKLPPEEIDAIGQQIGNDWEAAEAKSRIRFVTISGGGRDYMVYSRRADSGHTLSMIFAGTVPMHVIRRQGKRLLDVLVATPTEPPPKVEETTSYRPVEPDARAYEFPMAEKVSGHTPHTFIWVRHNEAPSLTERTVRHIVDILPLLLEQAGWQIKDFAVQADFVYLFAGMPTTLDARVMIRELMRVTGEMVSATTSHTPSERLWLDSYLVLQPGRSMKVEEVQRFIDFVRV